MKQEFTSKNTSINIKKLPAIYNKINWNKLIGKTVFDFGCGRPETVLIIQNFLEQYDIDYIPYDPYHQSKADQTVAFERRFDADVYIYGHTHIFSENKSNDKLYLNLDSTGCPVKTNYASAGILNINGKNAEYQALAVNYDVEKVKDEIKELKYSFYQKVLEIFYWKLNKE